MRVLKKIIVLLVRLGVSVILLLLLFKFQNIDVPGLLENIRHTDKLLLSLAFLMASANYIIGFYRWKMLLDAVKIHPPLKKIIGSYAGGIFFNAFLPSTIGGDVVRSLDLSAHTKKPKEVIATVFLDRLSGYIGTVIVVLFSLLCGWKYIHGNPEVLWPIAVVTAILVVILLVLFNSFLFSKINRLLGSGRAGRVQEALKSLHQELYYFKNHKAVLLKNLVFSLLIQAVSILNIYIISLSLGVNVSVLYFFIFFPIIGAITLLPIAIGGLGLRESMFVFFFSRAGIADNLSVAMSLLGFSFIVICAAIGGLVYVFTLRYRRLQRHPASRVSG